MHRDKSTHEGEEYINMYPAFRKWINQCIKCQARGYEPNMPEFIGKHGYAHPAKFIKKAFQCLPLNEQGLCEVCQR